MSTQRRPNPNSAFEPETQEIQATLPVDQPGEEHKNASDSEDGNEGGREKKEDKKPKRKPAQPRFKFEYKHLVDRDKGLKLFYEATSKLNIEKGDGRNEVSFFRDLYS